MEVLRLKWKYYFQNSNPGLESLFKYRIEILGNPSLKVIKEQSERRSQLESEISSLRRQILDLKNEVLKHAHCGDGYVSRHLAQMMKQIMRRDNPIVPDPLIQHKKFRSQTGNTTGLARATASWAVVF